MNSVKKYPFSMRKYGHNIQLAHNYMYCKIKDMEAGDIPWDDKMVDYYNQLTDVYANAISSPVYMATGKEYGVLKEASMWAENYRDERNHIR